MRSLTCMGLGVGLVWASLCACSTRALTDEGETADTGSRESSSTPSDPSGSGPGDSGPEESGPMDTGPFDDDGNIKPDFNDCAADPEGTICNVDGDCCSGHCYEVPVLSNLCGECNSDLDCPNGGCTVPNPLPGQERGAVCNFGELGGGCESDAVCDPGLWCAQVLEVPAFELAIQTCGQCRTDSDCGPGRVCNPNYEFADFSGYAECVVPDSIPLDEPCAPGPSGDVACASDHCEPVDVEGLFLLHVCGECSTDADCPGSAPTCLPGTLDLGTLTVAGPHCG